MCKHAALYEYSEGQCSDTMSEDFVCTGLMDLFLFYFLYSDTSNIYVLLVLVQESDYIQLNLQCRLELGLLAWQAKLLR